MLPFYVKKLMKYLNLVSAALCIVVCGCSNHRVKRQNEHGDAEIMYPYTVSIDIENAMPMADALESKQFISFSENVEHIMGYARNIVVRGDTIYSISTYPSAGIFAHLKNGEQLFAYCSVGSGPTDLNSPSCISVTDTEISTFDDSAFRTIVIGKDGKYHRSIEAPVMSLNAIVDCKGDYWVDFTNQECENCRVSYKAASDTAYQTVLEVPELLKGMMLIGIEAFQNLPDGTVGYTPAMEPRIYSLSDGVATVRYELDFNGLWPDDKTFESEFTGNDWAPKSSAFPVQSVRFHESDRYLVLGFKNKKQPYLHILDKPTGRQKTVLLDSDNYFSSSYVTDSELYLGRKDDKVEIMTIKEM